MRIIKTIVLTSTFFCVFAQKSSAQEITAIVMNAMPVKKSTISHLPGALVSPFFPFGKSKYDLWGLAYVQKDYLEVVVGVARNFGDFGFGVAVGPEYIPSGIEARVAVTAYYTRKKNSLYGYIEWYWYGGGIWYMAYYDRTINDWLAVGPYIQSESGIGGRLTLTIPKTPISVWGVGGHKGLVVGAQLFLKKK